MQAIALATGDEFLVPFNLTIDVENVIEYLKKLLVEWNDKNIAKLANFEKKYGIDFALVVGPSGFCYNFNMVNSHELFNLEMWQTLPEQANSCFKVSFQIACALQLHEILQRTQRNR
jgi:hypothetical protein